MNGSRATEQKPCSLHTHSIPEIVQVKLRAPCWLALGYTTCLSTAATCLPTPHDRFVRL